MGRVGLDRQNISVGRPTDSDQIDGVSRAVEPKRSSHGCVIECTNRRRTETERCRHQQCVLRSMANFKMDIAPRS